MYPILLCWFRFSSHIFSSSSSSFSSRKIWINNHYIHGKLSDVTQILFSFCLLSALLVPFPSFLPFLFLLFSLFSSLSPFLPHSLSLSLSLFFLEARFFLYFSFLSQEIVSFQLFVEQRYTAQGNKSDREFSLMVLPWNSRTKCRE